jgi:GAF domain-containing protein
MSRTDQVLHALVESAVSLLHADKGALLVLDAEKKCLTAKVTHGFSPETAERLSFALGEGIAGIVAQTGEPILTQDAANDERVPRRIKDAEGIHSIMQVPIKVGGEVFGVFSADFIQPHTFGSEDLRLLMSLAQRAALAIQNAQLYEQTQEKAIAEERNRLARELHDAVTQTLFSASLIAEALQLLYSDRMTDASSMNCATRTGARPKCALLLELRPSALPTSTEDLLRQLEKQPPGGRHPRCKQMSLPAA